MKNVWRKKCQEAWGKEKKESEMHLGAKNSLLTLIPTSKATCRLPNQRGSRKWCEGKVGRGKGHSMPFGAPILADKAFFSFGTRGKPGLRGVNCTKLAPHERNKGTAAAKTASSGNH